MHPMNDKREKIFEDDLTARKNGRRYLKYARVPFTGTAITERIPDNPFNLNTLLRRINYKNGKLHGPREQFHENGLLWIKENYKNGKRHGPREKFRENGQLYIRGNYKNGKRHGPWENFNEDGNLTKTETYEKGGLIE